jgi:hypothetical protein
VTQYQLLLLFSTEQGDEHGSVNLMELGRKWSFPISRCWGGGAGDKTQSSTHCPAPSKIKSVLPCEPTCCILFHAVKRESTSFIH